MVISDSLKRLSVSFLTVKAMQEKYYFFSFSSLVSGKRQKCYNFFFFLFFNPFFFLFYWNGNDLWGGTQAIQSHFLCFNVHCPTNLLNHIKQLGCCRNGTDRLREKLSYWCNNRLADQKHTHKRKHLWYNHYHHRKLTLCPKFKFCMKLFWFHIP